MIFIITFINLAVNILCLWLVAGVLSLQEYLYLFVYFVPVAINILTIFLMYRKNKSKIIKSSLMLMFAIIIAATVYSTYVYLNTSFSSVLFLWVFVFFFNLIPLTIFLFSYHFISKVIC